MLRDFERIDKLSKQMDTLEDAISTEIKSQFKEANTLYDNNQKTRGVIKREIAIALQHIMQKLMEAKITCYERGKCSQPNCDYYPIEDSNFCRHHNTH